MNELELENVIAKLAELKSIKTHLQLIGAYNPNEIETDKMIEDDIELYTKILQVFYGINIYEEVK